MPPWVVYAAPAAAVVVLVIALLLILRRLCRRKSRGDDVERGLQSCAHVIPPRPHQVTPDHHRVKGFGLSPVKFRWDDHPSLIVEAVENGWSRFAFTVLASSPARPAKAGLGYRGDQPGVAIGWEFCEGSAEFMQRIQLNPTGKTPARTNFSALSVIRTALPLPGPDLGNLFPREAYFEITVVAFDDSGDQFSPQGNEGDKVELISSDSGAKNSHRKRKKDDAKSDSVSMSVGLCGGGPLQVRLPGTYRGSIGFNSSGSVYHLGAKLTEEPPEKSEWKLSGKIVGCGFCPLQRKVIFTVDGNRVHEIFCKEEEFAAPLYPTLAATAEVAMVVNLGQRKFKYEPANLYRACNPCLFRTPETSPSQGHDDNFELRRMDSEWWLRRSDAVRDNSNRVSSIRNLEYDQESEGDLFEIPLDGVSTGRSPFAASSKRRQL